MSGLAHGADSLLERDLALAEIPTLDEVRSGLGFRDDAQSLPAVAGGFGDLVLGDAVGEGLADQVEELCAGGVGAGLFPFEGDGALAQLGEVVHGRERSTPVALANSVDKPRLLANTIGMTTTQEVLAKHLNRAVDLVLCAADSVQDIPAATDQPCTHHGITREHIEQCCAEGVDCDLCGNLIPWERLGLTVEQVMDQDLVVLCSACQAVTR